MRTVALTGPVASGKSTTFEAVARMHASRTGAVAVVDVPDERVGVVSRMYGSASAKLARIELVDVAGLDARALGRAREADALAVVLRGFGADADPARDLASFRAELAVADLTTVEGVRDRTVTRARSGDAAARAELDACERAEAVLTDDRWLSEVGWDAEVLRVIELWTPLTLKPVLHVLNAGEEGGDVAGIPEPVVEIRGLLEAEASELAPEEAAEMLSSYGLEASATTRFVRAVYDLLDLVTFFTANEREAHAWAVARGTRAPQAAGAVHSDLERGFIRAERIAFDDLVAAGSPQDAKRAGSVHIEGKDYVVQEGDVLFVRHS